MGVIASQITSLTIVLSTIYLDTDQSKHQSSVSLAFNVQGIHQRGVNCPHKWPVTRKMFLFDDVIMIYFLLWWPYLLSYIAWSKRRTGIVSYAGKNEKNKHIKSLRKNDKTIPDSLEFRWWSLYIQFMDSSKWLSLKLHVELHSRNFHKYEMCHCPFPNALYTIKSEVGVEWEVGGPWESFQDAVLQVVHIISSNL